MSLFWGWQHPSEGWGRRLEAVTAPAAPVQCAAVHVAALHTVGKTFFILLLLWTVFWCQGNEFESYTVIYKVSRSWLRRIRIQKHSVFDLFSISSYCNDRSPHAKITYWIASIKFFRIDSEIWTVSHSCASCSTKEEKNSVWRRPRKHTDTFTQDALHLIVDIMWFNSCHGNNAFVHSITWINVEIAFGVTNLPPSWSWAWLYYPQKAERNLSVFILK